MTTVTFPNFERNAIGFNRLLDSLSQTYRNSSTGYPPYDIVRTSDDTFKITLAVAGFSRNDISVEVERGLLRATGSRPESDSSVDYVHRGISGREFCREWTLADYVEVTGAELVDGLLTIRLERRVPDSMKRTAIEIK